MAGFNNEKAGDKITSKQQHNRRNSWKSFHSGIWQFDTCTWPIICLNSSNSDVQPAAFVFQRLHFHYSLHEFPIAIIHIPTAVVVVTRSSEAVAEEPCYQMKNTQQPIVYNIIYFYILVLHLNFIQSSRFPTFMIIGRCYYGHSRYRNHLKEIL